jgi:hypothetical protein
VSFRIVVALVVIVGISLQLMFFHRLRRRYPNEWVRLGSPSLFRPSNIQSGWQIAKYFWTGEFAKVPDKSIVRLGRVVQLYNWFGLIGFLTLTGLIFYSIFR